MIKESTGENACKNCPILLNCTTFTQETGEPCDYFFNAENLSDEETGGILLVFSLAVLVGSLVKLVGILNDLLKGPLAKVVKKWLNPRFDSFVANYLFSYVYIFLGMGVTILLQSSSVFTSTFTPMVGVGLIEVENVYPLFLGSNIGTTFTSFLAALTQGDSGQEKFKNALQGSLVHLFFNIFGILLFYPIPFMRFPVPMCKKLGKITATYRWMALVYIVSMFVLLPIIFMGLSAINYYLLIGFLLLAILIILTIVIITFMQKRYPENLPKCLEKWPEILPKLDKCFLKIMPQLKTEELPKV